MAALSFGASEPSAVVGDEPDESVRSFRLFHPTPQNRNALPFGSSFGRMPDDVAPPRDTYGGRRQSRRLLTWPTALLSKRWCSPRQRKTLLRALPAWRVS